jgi:hypothetical protein
MAINFNDLNQGRVGILGLDDVITQTPSAPLQTAFFKTKTQKLLEDMQKSGEIDQPTKIEGGAAGVGETSQEIPQNIKDDILNFIEKGIIKKKEPGAGDFLKDSLPDKFKNIDSQTLQNFIDQQVSLTNQFGFPLMASLDTSGVSKAIERAKEREALDIRKFMPGSIPGSVALSTTTTDPMDIREQNRLGNLAIDEILGDRAVTFDAPYMSTGLKMVPKPTFGQRLSGGINQLKTGFGKVKSDIGDFISSGGTIGAIAGGIGSLLNALFDTETPIDKFNKQFSVQKLGGDPYGYYDGLRAGNLTGQDPFGVNTVSKFGDYQKHYRDYLDAFNNQTKFKGIYTPRKTSKFAQDKADFAREVLGLKKTSPNITGTPLIVGGSVFEQDRGRDDDRGSTGGGGFGAADFGPGDDEFGAL